MLLSIGMIVKNEEKYLDECLSSIKPILDNIESELIIADTGSEDGTVDIAEKYTENVYHFEWTDDFAAARNSTLERAKGEWYLYIDADEIFESCDEIIDFFSSGEYKNFDSASYFIKNYNNLAKTVYTEAVIRRLVKRTPGLAFSGRVHESLNQAFTKEKRLNATTDHYGYINDDEEFKRRKYERNKALLLEELSRLEEPSPTFYFELAETLNVYNIDEAFEYYKKGYEAALREKHFTMYPLFGRMIGYYYAKNNSQEVVRLCKEYFELPEVVKKPVYADADVYFYGTFCLMNLGRHSECVEYGRRAVDLFMEIENGNFDAADRVFPRIIALKANIPTLLYYFEAACVFEDDFKLAAEYIRSVTVCDYYGDKANVENKLKFEFAVMRGIGDYSRISEIYGYRDPLVGAKLHVRIHIEFSQLEEHGALISALRSAFAHDASIMALCDAVSALDEGRDCKEAVENIPAESRGFFFDLMFLMIKAKADISPIVSLPDFNSKGAANFLRFCSEETSSYIENYPIDILSKEGLHGMLNFLEEFMTAIIQDEKSIDSLFSLYGQVGMRICETEQLDTSSLSGQLLAAVMAEEADMCRMAFDVRGCMNALIGIIKNYPPAKPFVLAYRDSLQKEIEQ